MLLLALSFSLLYSYQRTAVTSRSWIAATMSNLLEKTDVFPVIVSTKVKALPEPDFKNVATDERVFPFIMYMAELPVATAHKDKKMKTFKKLYYKPIDFDTQRKTHFTNTTSKLGPTGAVSKWDNWSSIEKRLLNAHQKHLKTTDQRTCFKYADHFFVVAQAFTFGMRTVEPGTRHIYQMHQTSMRIYFLKPRFRKRVIRKERYFEASQQCMFFMHKCKPHTCYSVPEGASYVITAPENCFFAVHVVNKDSQISVSCKNALSEAKKVEYQKESLRPYAVMPTPRIEDEVRYQVPVESPDPVLIEFPSSGQEMRMSALAPSPDAEMPSPDAELMPPPPPPPPPPAILTLEIRQIPVERHVQVVDQDTLKWYTALFKNREYPDPKPLWKYGLSEQLEPMDLSSPPHVPGVELTPPSEPATEADLMMVDFDPNHPEPASEPVPRVLPQEEPELIVQHYITKNYPEPAHVPVSHVLPQERRASEHELIVQDFIPNHYPEPASENVFPQEERVSEQVYEPVPRVFPQEERTKEPELMIEEYIFNYPHELASEPVQSGELDRILETPISRENSLQNFLDALALAMEPT